MAEQDVNLDVVKEYLIDNGGITRNVDLVRHFRKFLQSDDVSKKERNREKFKNFVNTLAAVKSDGGEKFIILKAKYYPLEWGGTLPGHIRSLTSPSGRSASFQDVSEPRAPSPTKLYKHTLHIPGLMVPVDNSDNESDCTTSLSTYSLESSASVNHLRRQTNPPKVLQNGAKSAKRSRTTSVDDKQGPRQTTQAFLGAGLLIQHKLDSSTTSLSQNSGEDKEETSSISTSYSAFDYELMDPSEHDWILFAVQNNLDGIQRLIEEEPHLVHRKDFITVSQLLVLFASLLHILIVLSSPGYHSSVQGYTATHWAAMNGSDQMLSTLLLSGADVNVKSMGATPLHLAAQRGYDHIIQLLITHYGAMADVRDHSGKRPKDIAKKTISTRSQELLDIGLANSSSKKMGKKKGINRKKSKSFSGGSLPSLNFFSTDEVEIDDEADGVRKFFKSPLSSFRRTWSIRRRSSSGVKRTGSGTVFDWTHE